MVKLVQTNKATLNTERKGNRAQKRRSMIKAYHWKATGHEMPFRSSHDVKEREKTAQYRLTSAEEDSESWEVGKPDIRELDPAVVH
ncbi:hypothetical protein SK128_020264 [Halocaridina rubra]|uniref:Uncharacterized protein n=1 Tax=Halocaridina rubra TaxID=373956 RepID=A0AAN8WVZ6_HALRR